MEHLRKDLEEAKAASTKAEEQRASADMAVNEVQLEHAQVRAELARIAELPEVTQADLVARENASRKLGGIERRLAAARAELEEAKTIAAAATERMEKAEAAVESVSLRDEARRDTAEIATLLSDFERTLRERLTAHQDLVDRANRAHWRTLDEESLASARKKETPFSTVSLETSEAMFDGALRGLTILREQGRAPSEVERASGAAQERRDAIQERYREQWKRADHDWTEFLLPGQKPVHGR